MSDTVEVARVAYARCLTLHMRCLGHWVNVSSPQFDRLGPMSVAAANGASLAAQVLADHGAAAPVSFYELEAVSSLPDVMSGSDEHLVGQDVWVTFSSAVEALNELSILVPEAGVEQILADLGVEVPCAA